MSIVNIGSGLPDEQDVIRFLKANPTFLSQNPWVVEELSESAQEKSVTSLVHIRLQQQRQRITELELQLSELVTIAADNEKLFHIYADIYTALYNCQSVSQMQRILASKLQSKLPLAAVKLHVNEAYFKIKPHSAPMAISAGKLIQVNRLKFAGRDHYLGPISGLEKLQLFHADALVNSVALMQLGERGQYGLLAVGSANASHFQMGMDNLLLAQLCRIISTLLPQLMPTRDKANNA